MIDTLKIKTLSLVRFITYFYFKIIKKIYKGNNFFMHSCNVVNDKLKLDYSDFRFHQISVNLSHLEHKLSLDYLKRLNKKILWDVAMPDVRLYMLMHSGCYYSAVGSIILNHKPGTKFFVPVLPKIINTLPGRSIKRLENLGYKIEIGSIEDKKFLISMLRSAKKEHETKIIMFVDLPSSIMNKASSNQELIFFDKKARLITGHVQLAKQVNFSCCLVSYNHNPFGLDNIKCSTAMNALDETDNFGQIVSNEIQILIKKSPIDWKYLHSIEFYFHHHT